MIYIYWPGKAVPEWLERVESCEGKPPTLTHAGWGFVLKRSGVYWVYILSGGFMIVSAGDWNYLVIEGGGNGVQVIFVQSFIKRLLARLAARLEYLLRRGA